MEVVIVEEVLNSCTIGVFSSELEAIKGIFGSIDDENENGGDIDINELAGCFVREDFRVYKFPINTRVYLTTSTRGDSIDIGEEIKYTTYASMKERQRELTINEIVD